MNIKNNDDHNPHSAILVKVLAQNRANFEKG